MQGSPYLIVKEFCNSLDEQQRRNSATALAALADPESLQELVRMGMWDLSPGVRERVEQEVFSLTLDERARIVQTVAEKIKERGEEGRRAYWFLGRLGARGLDLPPLGLSLRQRLGKAKALHGILYPSHAVSARIRGWVRAMVGAAAAATALGAAATFAGHDDQVASLWTSPLIAMAVSVLSMQVASPIRLHGDRRAGALLDLLITAAATLPVTIIMAAVLASNDATPKEIVAAALMLPVLAICTRFFMFTQIGLSESKGANRWLGIACGSAAGVLAVSSIPAWFGVGGILGISTLWFTLVPVAPGLAFAWSQLDTEIPGRLRMPVAVRLAGLLATAAFLVVAGKAAWPASGLHDIAPPQTRSLPVRSFPATISVHNKTATSLTISEKVVDARAGSSFSVQITPAALSKGTDPAPGVVPEDLVQEVSLPAGEWNLKVTCQCQTPALLAFLYAKVSSDAPQAIINFDFK